MLLVAGSCNIIIRTRFIGGCVGGEWNVKAVSFLLKINGFFVFPRQPWDAELVFRDDDDDLITSELDALFKCTRPEKVSQ